MSDEKFDSEGFEKLKVAFNEYEAEQRGRFKDFSVGLLKSSKVPQEANVPGAGWVKFVLLTHNKLSDLAKFCEDDQREFELQALLKRMKPSYHDVTEKDTCSLIEAGFEYVTEFEASKIFRKRKL